MKTDAASMSCQPRFEMFSFPSACDESIAMTERNLYELHIMIMTQISMNLTALISDRVHRIALSMKAASVRQLPNHLLVSTVSESASIVYSLGQHAASQLRSEKVLK